jgi:hypothetical protein
MSTCAFRFSQPLGALIRPEPTWPYSMPNPLMGFALQSFSLPRSRTLFPVPFPSWCFCTCRALLLVRIRHRLQFFRLKPAHYSPGRFPLQGFHSSCDNLAFARWPLLCFRLQAFPAEDAHFRVSFTRSPVSSLSRCPSFLGFSAFCFIIPVKV